MLSDTSAANLNTVQIQFFTWLSPPLLSLLFVRGQKLIMVHINAKPQIVGIVQKEKMPFKFELIS